MGFADTLFDEEWALFHQQLTELAEVASQGEEYTEALRLKRRERAADEAMKPLAFYREAELQKMHATFYDTHARYHNDRREFVYKGKVPAQLQNRFTTTVP